MWKHELIEHKYIIPGFQNKEISEYTKKALNEIDTYIQGAVQFYFGDYSKYSGITKKLTYEDVHKAFNPPYDVTAYVFNIMDNGNPEKDFFIIKKTQETRFIMLFFSYAEHIMSKWLLCPDYVVFDNASEHYTIRSIITGDIVTEKEELFIIGCMFSNVLRLTAVLNAKNIITKCKVPPEKLNKKRVKHKHTPYDKYHILEIVRGIPKHKYYGEVSWDYQSPEGAAFHWCRGHFKTYTEDAPLFGKYTGTFWWQPQARGKKECGVITKDYSVTLG